jgi:predicted GNAT family acetyltransferase
MYTMPIEGITELVGIATVPEFRRRGVATAVTAHVLQTAFAAGVDVACLSASDAEAGRIYRRVGFRPLGVVLAYTS